MELERYVSTDVQQTMHVQPRRRVDCCECGQQARPSTSFVDSTISTCQQSPEFGTKFQSELPLFPEILDVPCNTLWGRLKGNIIANKKLSYRRVTARCVLSVVILPIATKQCRNYLYDKSWPNWCYEVGGLVGGNVSWTMCTQPWRDRVGSHCLRCHKQTDDARIVYITCIPTTCCGEIF